MTSDPYIQSSIKLNYAFNGRIMISSVKEVNGRCVRVLPVAQQSTLFTEKNAGSRFFAVVCHCAMEKTNFSGDTREYKKKEGKGKEKMLYTNVLFHEIEQTDGRTDVPYRGRTNMPQLEALANAPG